MFFFFFLFGGGGGGINMLQAGGVEYSQALKPMG